MKAVFALPFIWVVSTAAQGTGGPPTTTVSDRPPTTVWYATYLLGPDLTNAHKDNFDTPWRRADCCGLGLHTAVRDDVWECCRAVEWDGRAGNADGGGGEGASVEGGGCEGAGWRAWVKGWYYGVGDGVVDVVCAVGGRVYRSIIEQGYWLLSDYTNR